MGSELFYTAARSLEIERGTVTSGLIDVNGHLILSTRGGTAIDAGNVKGSDATVPDAQRVITLPIQAAAALPSSYPLGISIFYVTIEAGYPAQYMSVTTVYPVTSNRVTQTAVSAATGNIWTRGSTNGSTWSAWLKSASSNDVALPTERLHYWAYNTDSYKGTTLPSGYSYGVTIHQTNGNGVADGWPATYGVVQTTRNTNYTAQVFTQYNGQIWTRSANGDVWTDWAQPVSPTVTTRTQTVATALSSTWTTINFNAAVASQSRVGTVAPNPFQGNGNLMHLTSGMWLLSASMTVNFPTTWFMRYINNASGQIIGSSACLSPSLTNTLTMPFMVPDGPAIDVQLQVYSSITNTTKAHATSYPSFWQASCQA